MSVHHCWRGRSPRDGQLRLRHVDVESFICVFDAFGVYFFLTGTVERTSLTTRDAPLPPPSRPSMPAFVVAAVLRRRARVMLGICRLPWGHVRLDVCLWRWRGTSGVCLVRAHLPPHTRGCGHSHRRCKSTSKLRESRPDLDARCGGDVRHRGRGEGGLPVGLPDRSRSHRCHVETLSTTSTTLSHAHG